MKEIIQGKDYSFNRKILEQKKSIILMSPEKFSLSDNLKALDSGINEISARIASRNNNLIGINLEEIKKISINEKAIRLSKIRQNIKICRKAKTGIYISGKKEMIIPLMIALGASGKQAKEAATQYF